MPHLQYCPNCRKPYQIPDTHLGRKVRCNQCSTTFIAQDENAASSNKAPEVVIPKLQGDESPMSAGVATGGAASFADAGPSRPAGAPAREAMSATSHGSTIAGEDLDSWLDFEDSAASSQSASQGGVLSKLGSVFLSSGSGSKKIASAAAAQDSGLMDRLSAVAILLVIVGIIAVVTGDSISRHLVPLFDSQTHAIHSRALEQIGQYEGERVSLSGPIEGPSAVVKLPYAGEPGQENKRAFLLAGLVQMPANVETAGDVMDLPNPNLPIQAVVVATDLEKYLLDNGQVDLGGFTGVVRGVVEDQAWLNGVELQNGQVQTEDGLQPTTVSLPPQAWVIEQDAPYAGVPVLSTALKSISAVGYLLLLGGGVLGVFAWVSGGLGGGTDFAMVGVVAVYAVLGWILISFVGGAGFKYWVWLGVLGALILAGFGWLGLASSAAQRSTVQGLLCLIGAWVPVQIATRWKQSREAVAYVVAGVGLLLTAIGGVGSVAGQASISGPLAVAGLTSFSSKMPQVADFNTQVSARLAYLTPQEAVDFSAQSLDETAEKQAGGTLGHGQVANNSDLGQGQTQAGDWAGQPSQSSDQSQRTIGGLGLGGIDVAEGKQTQSPIGAVESQEERPTLGLSEQDLGLDLEQGSGRPSGGMGDGLGGGIGGLMGDIQSDRPKKRTLADVVEEGKLDPQLRGWMDSEEVQIGGYGFFVSNVYDRQQGSVIVKGDEGRWVLNPARVLFKIVPRVGNMRTQPTPVMTDENSGRQWARIRGKLEALPKDASVAEQNIGGLDFQRVVMPEDKARDGTVTRTVYFLAYDDLNSLTFELKFPVSMTDTQRQKRVVSLMEATMKTFRKIEQ